MTSVPPKPFVLDTMTSVLRAFAMVERCMPHEGVVILVKEELVLFLFDCLYYCDVVI